MAMLNIHFFLLANKQVPRFTNTQQTELVVVQHLGLDMIDGQAQSNRGSKNDAMH
jgi:hypothetical protein